MVESRPLSPEEIAELTGKITAHEEANPVCEACGRPMCVKCGEPLWNFDFSDGLCQACAPSEL